MTRNGLRINNTSSRLGVDPPCFSQPAGARVSRFDDLPRKTWPDEVRNAGLRGSICVSLREARTFLLPTKDPCGERGEKKKRHCQRSYVTQVGRPPVSVPDAFEQAHGVGHRQYSRHSAQHGG